MDALRYLRQTGRNDQTMSGDEWSARRDIAEATVRAVVDAARLVRDTRSGERNGLKRQKQFWTAVRALDAVLARFDGKADT